MRGQSLYNSLINRSITILSNCQSSSSPREHIGSVFCTVGDKAHTVILTRSLKFKPTMPNLIWKSFLSLVFQLSLKVNILWPFYFSLYKMQSDLDTDIDHNKDIVLDDEMNCNPNHHLIKTPDHR